ncbi:MAG: shikimate dehydrogenase [Pseudomonadota bacterium]
MQPSPDRYAVIGNPIAHSKSPLIHALFAKQTGQAMRYERILAPLEGFRDAVWSFRDEGGRGLNVTIPFKLEACALADTLSERARRAGAVNTLTFSPDGRIEGDNTDGAGLVRDLLGAGIGLRGRRILLLGAGGAVRGVLAPLLAEEPTDLVIANRTAEKAVQLAADFADLGPVRGCGFDALQGEHFDLIVNGTSASLSGELPPLPEDLLTPGGDAYDMAYGNEPTPFQRWALAHGACHALDGLGMLVEQAAESFRLWRGVLPDTTGARRSLNAKP